MCLWMPRQAGMTEEKTPEDDREGDVGDDISLFLVMTLRKTDLKTENKRLFVGKKCLKEVKSA